MMLEQFRTERVLGDYVFAMAVQVRKCIRPLPHNNSTHIIDTLVALPREELPRLQRTADSRLRVAELWCPS